MRIWAPFVCLIPILYQRTERVNKSIIKLFLHVTTFAVAEKCK